MRNFITRFSLFIYLKWEAIQIILVKFVENFIWMIFCLFHINSEFLFNWTTFLRYIKRNLMMISVILYRCHRSKLCSHRWFCFFYYQINISSTVLNFILLVISNRDIQANALLQQCQSVFTFNYYMKFFLSLLII